MSTKASEIHIRQQTKAVLKHLEDQNLEEARQIILNNKDILKYNFGLINFLPLLPRIRFSKRIPKSFDALRMVIETGIEIYSKEDNVEELLFFAAASCDIEKLRYCIDRIVDGINQVREGDTALMFLIKYGNIMNERYVECLETLIKAGIDVNRSDYYSHSPIGFLAISYERFVNSAVKDKVEKCIQLLLATNQVDVTNLKVEAQETLKKLVGSLPDIVTSQPKVEDVLFKLLVTQNEDAFIANKELGQHLDVDDGNNTLLQLCSEKNLKKAAEFLIAQGADVNKVTERNQQTPLELAARRNNQKIFTHLLSSNRVTIDQELFLTFLRGRPKHIKASYFDEILKYELLDVNIKSANGNTPLHYAIIFSSSDAIKILLKRGASLTVENDSKKCPLDYISPEDLENHLNRCVIPDRHNDVSSGKYEVALNFRNLVEEDESRIRSELTIVEKVCSSSKLCHLLQHPLISSFIDIKWQLVQPLYQKLFIFHVLFYMVTTLAFINLDVLTYISLPLACIYGLRSGILFSWKNNKLHNVVDSSVALILLTSFFISSNVLRYQLGIAATMLMAFSFHLFWRFSPNFAQFHAFLVHITTQLFSFVFYISSLILFFGAAFYIFFLVGNESPDDQTKSPQYYLMCVFGVFVCVTSLMTVVRSVTYLYENTENIKQNFGVLANKNTLIFLDTAEKFYLKNAFIPNPFVFSEVCEESGQGSKKEKKGGRGRNRYFINFFVNTNKFSFERLVEMKLADSNVHRIKKAVHV